MKEVLIIFLILCLPFVVAITGEIITGEVSQAPTNVSVFVVPGPPTIYIFSPKNITYYETELLFNYSIKNNFSHAWYNLDNSGNISLPNITDNSFNFNTTLGTHTLYLYANNTLGENNKNVTFIVSSSSSTSSGGSSSSSGSSSGRGARYSFILNKNLFEVTLAKGDARKETVLISNTGNKPLEFSFETQDLEDFLLLDVEPFTLDPGATREIELNFFSLSKILPGLYFGKITVKGGHLEKDIHVIIDLKDVEALFDINLEILPSFKYIQPGRKISTLVTLSNIGMRGTAVDVELVLRLMDFNKKVLYESSSEFLAVKTDLTITREVQVPDNIEDGLYLVIGDVKYNAISASSYDTLSVNIDPSPGFIDYITQQIKYNLWIQILLIISIILIIILIIIVARKNKKKKRKIKKKKIKKKS